VSYTFDWHAEGRDSFVGWALVHILPPMTNEQMGKLSEETDKFTNVTLTIQVNGIEMDAKPFLDGIDRNMEHFAKVEARKMVAAMTKLNRMDRLMEFLQEQVELVAREELRDAGIEIPEGELNY
jgi:hypothetical protein